MNPFAQPRPNHELTLALVDWSQLIEDFLDNIGVSFEAFCNEMSGGWMFGYIAALKTAGVRVVLFCVSARVDAPQRFKHRATGATICVLPAPAVYRVMRRHLPNPYADTLEDAAGDVQGLRRLLLGASKNIASYLSTPLVHLCRELRREGCGVILCQDYEHGRFDLCLIAGKLLRIPVFASFQGGDRSHSSIEKFTRSFALAACDGLVIASSREAVRVQKRYGISSEKIGRIFNPLDFSEWQGGDRKEARATLGINTDTRVVAWHGRVLMHFKGLDVLLDAWKQICRKLDEKDVRLLMVGSGYDREALRGRIEELGLGHSVVWVDEYVRDRVRLKGYLAAADVYVLSSRHEGFPVAPIEAMACGLPVVATDVPGARDIFESGEESGGIIVPCGDSTALTEGLLRVLGDEELRRRMSMNARRWAEGRFSLNTVGRQLREFFVCCGA